PIHVRDEEPDAAHVCSGRLELSTAIMGVSLRVPFRSTSNGHAATPRLRGTMFLAEATMSDVKVFTDKNELVTAEAERVIALAGEAIRARGRCLVALSGGSTPRPLYELLATERYAKRIDWSGMHLFWGDERCVPPEHPDSNYRMTREAMIDHVPIPRENVHRILGEDPPDQAAAAYERLLRRFFGPDDMPARTFD